VRAAAREWRRKARAAQSRAARGAAKRGVFEFHDAARTGAPLFLVFLLLSLELPVKMAAKSDSIREFISTAQAARQLGLSLGAVQQMVESGALAGWKTAGGHRRIRQDSVDSLLARARNHPAAPVRNSNGRLRVLVVEDDRLLQNIYRETFSTWGLPMDVQVIDHGLDALVEVGREPPDLLIADLRIPGIDGFEMIRRLRDNPLSSEIAIVVVSALNQKEIAAAGGLPEDVTVYRKPIPFHELHGYMQALIAQRRRIRHTG
jgi:excisionase family DNA binding protein